MNISPLPWKRKQNAYRKSRAEWAKEVGLPYAREPEFDLTPDPGEVDLVDPENG